MAVADRLLSDSPVDRLKSRRRNKPIRLTPSYEQFEQIVADIRAQVYNADSEDSADFIELLGRAGLGQAEAAALKRSDIDLERGLLHTFRCKTRRAFDVPIFPSLRPLIDRLLSRPGTRDDKLLRIRDAKKSLTGACRRLGLPRFSQRSLRRMFITRAIEKGVDVKVIAEWQGHVDSGVLILQSYSHVNRAHSIQMAQLI
jgi:integrase